ncbi:MAG: hypothetical protein HYT87_11720 [Nitrospirae bacterium]|nr:hypothetical protein [Nitrospirota bacterium]
MPGRVVRARFISPSREDLSPWLDRCDHFYIGSEFCEHLIPSSVWADRMVKDVCGKGKRLSLLTPPVGESGLRRIGQLFSLLSKAVGDPYEVVVNDWGVYRLARENGLLLRLGRLLLRQTRDPRLVPRDDGRATPLATRVSEPLIGLLCELGFRGLETDVWDTALFEMIGPRLDIALYVPFRYLTTTRLCAVARLRVREASDATPVIKACDLECQNSTFVIREGPLGERILAGNTLFILSKYLEKDALPHVGRIVEFDRPI